MARENTVFMMGLITEKPMIKVNVDNEFVVSRIKIMTVRRTKASKELKLLGTPRVDIQHIITRNPVIIEKRIVPLCEGDLILVKGSICTRETSKKYVCPYCGNVNVYEGAVMVYIDPIFIEKVHIDKLTGEEAKEKLLSKAEVSNYAFIFGTLCRDPIYYNDPKGRKEECDFQIATNRKRRIVEDGPDKAADYPYVKTYGAQAKEAYEMLHTGSEIYINGAIQSREITMNKICMECESEFQAAGASMEIVPYSIEYLRNCNIPSMQAEEDEAYEDMGYEAEDKNDGEME